LQNYDFIKHDYFRVGRKNFLQNKFQLEGKSNVSKEKLLCSKFHALNCSLRRSMVCGVHMLTYVSICQYMYVYAYDVTQMFLCVDNVKECNLTY